MHRTVKNLLHQIILSARKNIRKFRLRNLHFLGRTSFFPRQTTSSMRRNRACNENTKTRALILRPAYTITIPEEGRKKLPFLGKSGTTRILVLIPLIRGSSPSLFPDIVNEVQKIIITQTKHRIEKSSVIFLKGIFSSLCSLVQVV